MIFSITKWALKKILRSSQTEFLNSLENPKAAQAKVLQEIIQNISNTNYGKIFKLKETDSYDQFREKLPISTYESLRFFIEREKLGKNKNLLHQEPLNFEKTSGSSGAAKYIPYGKDLKRSFTKMFQYWLYDILENGPDLKTGKSYFSISPNFKTEFKTESGTPIGLEGDDDYLSTVLRFCLKPFWTTSKSLKKIKDPKSFKHILAAQLLSEFDLEAISVWNPSFLKILLDYITENTYALLSDLDSGRIYCEGLKFQVKPLKPEQREGLLSFPIDWTLVWPKLKFISCWSDARAIEGALELKKLLPQALVQGKGLLATESPMTFPLFDAKGFVPLLDEVFFEFENDSGEIFLLHELKNEEAYSILITQKGGLSRYRIGDRISVTHHYKSTPCFKFLGRTGGVSDLVGEKLNENFVQGGLRNGFKVLLPVKGGPSAPHYALIGESLDADLEDYLSTNPHYRNARLLGQLGPLENIEIKNIEKKYTEFLVNRGMKWGDIKPQNFICNLEIASEFRDWLKEDFQSLES
jgi:hypothetical protein